MPSTILCGALTALISLATASPVSRRITSPSVILDQATVIGTQSGAVNLFLGIPFAEPPIGDLRFRLPQAASSYNGTLNATAFGPACIQQTSTVDIPTNLSPIAAALLLAEEESSVPIPDSEDCLTINVIAPANTTADSKLPVLFWIYGGGFEDGVSSSVNGSVVVERALALGQPVVYVSVNYRLAALGFPGSKEVREARIGNLGLHDQRLGMQWVQKYISTFGGDPTKVMIWGESAGAISVALQMLNNGGNPDGLFRAAFMQSGSPPPVGPVEDGQAFFDTFATVAGCGSSLGSVAVFDCLRNVSTEVIRNATNATPSITSYQSLSLAWQPREDGVFLTADPQQLVLQGSVAPVPFVSGDCDDEGTLFALTNSNITTEQELTTYLEQFYVKSANASAAVAEVLALYPQDPTAGSPFDTGLLNVITLQYKRIAAILGDLVFQAPRRFFLSETAGKQSHWVFLNKRGKSTPIVGSAHGSDVAIIYSGGDMTDYLIRFAVNLDPNGGNTIGNEITWPAYNATALTPELLTFLDGPALEIGTDTYRAAGMEALTRISLSNPL